MAEKCWMFTSTEINTILGFDFDERVKEEMDWEIDNGETWYLEDAFRMFPNEDVLYEKMESYMKGKEDLPWVVRFAW
jgi:hypothetical protein